MKDLDFSYETFKERDEKVRKKALIYALSVLRKFHDDYKTDYNDTLFTIPETKEGWDDRNFELYGLNNIIGLLERAIEEIEQIVWRHTLRPLQTSLHSVNEPNKAYRMGYKSTVKRKRAQAAKRPVWGMQRTARYYTAKAMVIDAEHGEPKIETINLRVYALSKDAAIKEMKKSFPEAVLTEIQGHIAKFVMSDEDYFKNSKETETVESDDESPVDDWLKQSVDHMEDSGRQGNPSSFFQ